MHWVTALTMVAAAGSQARDPLPPADLAAYIVPDDYPPLAIRNGEQGRVVAMLAIDAKGRVTACDAPKVTATGSLEAATCRIALTRLTFTPARDARGRAVAGRYAFPMRWVLPVVPAVPAPAVS